MRRLADWLGREADLIVAVGALYIVDKTEGWWSLFLGAFVAGGALAIAEFQGKRKGRKEAQREMSK